MPRFHNDKRYRKFHFRLFIVGLIAGLSIALALFSFPAGSVYAQQPTGSVPTVTGTPTGPMVTVYSDQLIIDVYAGPSSYNYDRIGILVSGEKAPALGYSQDGNWIEIVYPGVPGGTGWVYGPFVSISPGSLPRIAAPPTAAPRTTPTLDPTAVAAFGVQLEPTHLPTFTPPAPLKLPTFTPDTGARSKVPLGLVILILAFIGVLGAVISFLRGNR
jgi:hypothetical protein